MKNIVFKEQGMQNFCNHIDPVIIKFENKQITMITGPNGAGKTSVLQSIPFTLYGQCEKGRNEDVLNTKIGKNCHTWTEFSIDDVDYRVDRYVKAKRVGNTVTIKRGNSDKPYKTGHKEVVPEIEKLLMPYKLFMNTLLFSQKVKTFFTDLGDADQKEIFRKILTLDDFVLYMTGCGGKLKELGEKILKMNQDMAVYEGLIKENKESIEELKVKKKEFLEAQQLAVAQFSEQIDQKRDEMEKEAGKLTQFPGNLELEVTAVNTRLGELNQTLSSLVAGNMTKRNEVNSQAELKKSELQKQNLEMIQEEQKMLNTQIEELRTLSSEKGQEIMNKKSDLDKLNHQIDLKLTSIASDKRHLEAEIKELDINFGVDNCPTCRQTITHECIEHLETLKGNKENELQLLIEECTRITNERNERLLEIKKLDTAYQDNASKYSAEIAHIKTGYTGIVAAYNERLTIASGKVDAMVKQAVDQIIAQGEKETEKFQKEEQDFQKKLTDLNSVVAQKKLVVDKVSKIEQDIKGLDIQMEAKEQETFDDSMKESALTKIDQMKKIIAKVDKDRSAYTKKIKMLEFWKKGFSSAGIQSMLIDEAIPFMNKKIAEYMELLCGGRYTVTFDTLKATKGGKEFRDKISVEVFDNQTHADKRVKFSGGQTRLVDIGTILTLADLQSKIQDTKINIILFDEIFDALDDDNIRFAANLLRLASQDKWVGIISHRHIDSVEADSVLGFN